LTTLYSFGSQSGDGANPYAGLVQAANGDFYGTTYDSGAKNCVFVGGLWDGVQNHPKWHSDDAIQLRLPKRRRRKPMGYARPGYQWEPVRDYQARRGHRFGGTVFQITPSGRLTTLHRFDGRDGSNPEGLIQATDGNFYGTTQIGGANGDGTIFKITPSGKLTTLYSFCSQGGCSDGTSANSGLIQATNGDFYGTTRGGWGQLYQRLWHGLQRVCRSWPVCGNATHLRQGRRRRQGFRGQSDRRNQRHI